MAATAGSCSTRSSRSRRRRWSRADGRSSGQTRYSSLRSGRSSARTSARACSESVEHAAPTWSSRFQSGGCAWNSRRPQLLTALLLPAEERVERPADAAGEHESGGRRRHLQVLLVAPHLRAPVGQLPDLIAQQNERHSKLLAVLLHGGADLLRGAVRHQPFPVEVVTVSRIFLASSIAIVGAGGPTLIIFRASKTAMIASSSRAPVTIAKPIQMSPTPLTRIASSAQAIVIKPVIRAKSPKTAPAPKAATPRSMLMPFCLTSVLASSIASWTRLLRFSET